MPVQPASRAVPMARAARLAAARPEAAFPPRSRVAAITGAAIGVLMTAASAFRPRTSSDFPWIFVCPNFAPCLACAGQQRGPAGQSREEPPAGLLQLAHVSPGIGAQVRA